MIVPAVTVKETRLFGRWPSQRAARIPVALGKPPPESHERMGENRNQKYGDVEMAEPDFNWPKKGDMVFGRLERAALGAFVMPDDGTYLAGFKRAGDMIVAAAQADGHYPDDLFFPVAYLYRHHLELMLKELVCLGLRLGSSNGCDDMLGKHDLQNLWSKVKEMILSGWPDSPADELNAAEKMIGEFHKLDPTGQAFRYARDKRGEPHLQNAPRRIDLDNLKTKVDALSNYLDAAYAGIESCDPGPL